MIAPVGNLSQERVNEVYAGLLEWERRGRLRTTYGNIGPIPLSRMIQADSEVELIGPRAYCAQFQIMVYTFNEPSDYGKKVDLEPNLASDFWWSREGHWCKVLVWDDHGNVSSLPVDPRTNAYLRAVHTHLVSRGYAISIGKPLADSTIPNRGADLPLPWASVELFPADPVIGEPKIFIHMKGHCLRIASAFGET